MALRRSTWILPMSAKRCLPNNSPQSQKHGNGSKYHYLEFITMATYPVVNKNTGEQKEVVMSIHDWDQWLSDNPDWTRDWSDPSTAPMATDVGEWRDKLIAKNPGWNEVLAKASKAPGAKNLKI
jgi:hypothetical protein